MLRRRQSQRLGLQNDLSATLNINDLHAFQTLRSFLNGYDARAANEMSEPFHGGTKGRCGEMAGTPLIGFSSPDRNEREITT